MVPAEGIVKYRCLLARTGGSDVPTAASERLRSTDAAVPAKPYGRMTSLVVGRAAARPRDRARVLCTPARQRSSSLAAGVRALLLFRRDSPRVHLDFDRLRLVARVVVDHRYLACNRIAVLAVVGVGVGDTEVEDAFVDIVSKRRQLLQIAVRVELEMRATSYLALVHTCAGDRASD